MTFTAFAPSSGTQTSYGFTCSNSGLSIPIGTTITLFGTIVS